ncbi:outer membrane beta-barrel protein [Ferruginibacter sp.]|uniref:outer membrane beta-barrel protein n=1 Tax=Ferruginibacter sp. TaxID=1940288 RepID=UPI00265A2B09|nr:outer membrane beta-barrel protein [Ferruginibacter sp.]
MTKFAFLLFALISFSAASAQLKPKKDWSKVDIDRSGDHIMLQLGSDHWSGAPDSISSRIKGFSRGLNFYIMLNKPFKSDPRWSVAFGVGVSSSNIVFKKTSVGILSTGTLLPFSNLDSSNYFKKYKLATSFLEAPIELRYTVDPSNEAKSWKFALGVKVGTMVNVHTKGKTLVNKSGSTLLSYTEKESRNTYFNTTRLAGTARVGMGHFSVFGAYSITSFLKDGAGPSIRPYQFGLTISGL